MMKRDYSTGVTDNAEFFVGTEVEKTPTQGMKTLFVVRHQEDEDIEKYAKENNCTHIYLGANHCFKYFDALDKEMLMPTIKKLLQNYHVTLDVPGNADLKEITNFLSNPKFSIVYAVPVENIMEMKGNVIFKIDDKDFKATNPGVWCWSVRDLIKEEHFTDCNEYGDDEIL